MSLFESVSASELDAARCLEFDAESVEYRRFAPPHRWVIRNVMPINFQSYCAVVLPWTAYEHGRAHPGGGEYFRGLARAYQYFDRVVPDDLDLDNWHRDFRITEQVRIVPVPFRAVMNTASRAWDTVYVRCDPGFGDPVCNWKIDRELFFTLDDPFTEMPSPREYFEIFPRGAAWFLHHHDTEPILYLAGSAELTDEIGRVLGDQFVRLSLDDRYY